jgi:hypothetical protein
MAHGFFEVYREWLVRNAGKPDDFSNPVICEILTNHCSLANLIRFQALD